MTENGAAAAGARGPRVSVIVPVRNRRDLLIEMLDGLAGQTLRDFELIVVDDGSTDGAGEEAERSAVGARPVTVLQAGGQGAVIARRIGAAAATAPVLAFTDSDCVPEPRWLELGVAAVEEGADVVNGFTCPTRKMKPLERSIWSGEEGLFPTCNMFFRRSAYEAVGGFDERAAEWLGFRPDEQAKGRGHGEDTILGWLVQRNGGTHRYVPEAVVRHQVFPPDHRETLSRTWQIAAFPALVRALPELRPTMVHYGVLFGDRNRIPVYATALGLLLRRKGLVAAALGWWTWMRVRDMRGLAGTRAEKARAVPVEMAVDAVTAAALVTGSVRTRTVLL